jgi:hypothetical protein
MDWIGMEWIGLELEQIETSGETGVREEDGSCETAGHLRAGSYLPSSVSDLLFLISII